MTFGFYNSKVLKFSLWAFPSFTQGQYWNCENYGGARIYYGGAGRTTQSYMILTLPNKAQT